MKMMKKSVLTVIILGASMALTAQTLAMNTMSKTYGIVVGDAAATDNNSATETASNTAQPRFVFRTDGYVPEKKTAFEEEHYLGGEVSKKWNTFIANYTHEYSVSVGLSGSGYEFVKPAVYNAVNRADKYVRKALKKHLMTRDEAVTKISHILDCANVIYYEHDTTAFETAAREAKTGEDAVKLFESVKLINE